jgi:hypothetical protein
MEINSRWSVGFAAALILAHTAIASAQSWKLVEAAGRSTIVTVKPAAIAIESSAGRLEIRLAQIVEVGYSRRLLRPDEVIEQWDPKTHDVLNAVADGGEENGGAALLAVGVLAFASVEALAVPEHRIDIVWLDKNGSRVSTTVLARTPTARPLFDRLRKAVATEDGSASDGRRCPLFNPPGGHVESV